MRVNWCINQEMIITQLINIMRINWSSNREDFKSLDDGRSDRHRGSVGGLTAIEISLTTSLCSTPDMLINSHKWILLVRSMTPVRDHIYKRHWGFRKYFSQFSLLPPFPLTTLLWCWVAWSLPALLLVIHEEKRERDLRTIAIVKPSRRMSIRFLGSVSARLLGAVRSWSSTSTVCFVYLALIIKASTKSRGEHMIPPVAMG
jgi:hypothetical protein